MVATTGVFPVLTGVKAAISPVPLAGRPIDVLLLVQVKMVLEGEPVKITSLVDEPTQITWLGGCATFGVG
jgi:hypothetical protein